MKYKIQDMLGTTRVVIESAGGGIITGQYDYEPFGKVMWQSGAPTRLGFIDKEKDKESSLGDFGVRKYDDGSGRFTSIDPLWEKYRNLTPYHYVLNNPLRLIDPSGFDTTAVNSGINRHGNVSITEDMDNLKVSLKPYIGTQTSLGVGGVETASYSEKVYNDGSVKRSVTATHATGFMGSTSETTNGPVTSYSTAGGYNARGPFASAQATVGGKLSYNHETHDLQTYGVIQFDVNVNRRLVGALPFGLGIATLSGLTGLTLSIEFNLTPQLPTHPYTATCTAEVHPEGVRISDGPAQPVVPIRNFSLLEVGF